MASSLKGRVVINYKDGHVREYEIEAQTLLRELTGDADPSPIVSAAIDITTDDGRSVEISLDGTRPEITAHIYEGVT